MINLILDIDSYKASHFNQYPPETKQVSSYIEARGGKYSHTIFFGLQKFLKKYLSRPFTLADIEHAEQILSAHGMPFNKEGWLHILEKHDGYLPIKIEAVEEGKLVDTKNVLVQVTNTDDKCFWLVSYIETSLLRATWYPVTVATLSFKIKQIIRDFLVKTADFNSPEELEHALEFKLHDFGARGSSSTETSGIGGLAHLVSFKSTDCIPSLLDGQLYYQEPMSGYSIPAAEHSTITAWGQEKEFEAYEAIIDNYLKPGKAVSIVCDSYDMNYALEHMIGSDKLKNKIINSGGTLVIRPDSGVPEEIVLSTAQKLEQIFGSSKNSKGYKVLPPYIRIIQGDGINTNSIIRICQRLMDEGFSIENITFGMGAELQQKVNRDTCRFAMKASAVRLNDGWHDAFKAPVTDPSKTSKKGILKLILVDGKYQTVRADDPEYDKYPNQLRTVYLNGKLEHSTNFERVFANAQAALDTEVTYYPDK